MSPLHIVVHRKKAQEMDRVFKDTIDDLGNAGIDISVDRRRYAIDINKFITLYFRCGEVWRMSGMRCDIFNVDTDEAYLYLRTFHSTTDKPSSDIPRLDVYIDVIAKALSKEEKNE